MRLKSEIWIKAYLRRCGVQGVAAVVGQRGDSDAGAIYLKVDSLDGNCHVFAPAPAGLVSDIGGRLWVAVFDGAGADARESDDYLKRQKNFDPDLWIIEIEDRQGRHFLDDDLVDADDLIW